MVLPSLIGPWFKWNLISRWNPSNTHIITLRYCFPVIMLLNAPQSQMPYRLKLDSVGAYFTSGSVNINVKVYSNLTRLSHKSYLCPVVRKPLAMFHLYNYCSHRAEMCTFSRKHINTITICIRQLKFFCRIV